MMKIKEREREGKEARIVKRAGLAPPPFPLSLSPLHLLVSLSGGAILRGYIN